jgi:hypothetical protein
MTPRRWSRNDGSQRPLFPVEHVAVQPPAPAEDRKQRVVEAVATYYRRNRRGVK